MLSNEYSSKPDPLLIGTGIFALLWTVARAAVQSVTIDEADTYLSWVMPRNPAHWNVSANNHVLYSLLERLVTSIFGASPFLLRIPALVGAALFLAAAYCLVRLIAECRWQRLALFVCLTFSPLVMDYLVAARGYGLASAFLLWMVAIAGRYQARDLKTRALQLRGACALISVCEALSIAANFSFALADLLVGLGLMLWIAREQRRESLKILLWFTWPGLVTGYFLVGSVVLAWSKSQFTWGADSLWNMLRSLVSASLFEPNPYLLNPRIHHYFVHFGTFLYPILAVFVIWRIVMLEIELKPNALATVCGSALLAAVAAHEVLHLAFGILLPLDRTAMWEALLFLAMAGALAATPLSSPAGRISGKAMTGILAAIAIYNVGCLRLNYFNEWKYDADMKNVYALLANYNHTYGMTRVATNWRYTAALNSYRAMSGHETLDAIPGASSVVGDYPAGYQAYVLYYPADQDYLAKEGLKLVYRDPLSQAAVAIRPEVESGGR